MSLLTPTPGASSASWGNLSTGFDELATLSRAVSIFGSARTSPDDPDYKAAQETAAFFARAGFGVITGGGPGIMEAANQGAFEAGGLSIGCNIELPFEQSSNRVPDQGLKVQILLRAQDDVRQIQPGLHYFSRRLWHTRRTVRSSYTHSDKEDSQLSRWCLYGSEYWRDATRLDSQRGMKEGKISEQDLKLLHLTDSPAEVVKIIVG